jgi:3-hydroxyisobutyrate dehydrogenase-like beta-hydroxyacid dehydrogenase
MLMTTIGYVGLGAMGTPLAGRLLDGNLDRLAGAEPEAA